jgi:hypothetical protein
MRFALGPGFAACGKTRLFVNGHGFTACGKKHPPPPPHLARFTHSKKRNLPPCAAHTTKCRTSTPKYSLWTKAALPGAPALDFETPESCENRGPRHACCWRDGVESAPLFPLYQGTASVCRKRPSWMRGFNPNGVLKGHGCHAVTAAK